MRACDHNRMTIPQKKLRQGLREGEKGEALPEHRLHLRVRHRDGITHDDEVRLISEVMRRESLAQLDSQRR